MWLGAAVFTVGSGLLHTLARSSPMKEWFGYQVLGGIGYGVTVQIPFFAIQVVLSQVDIPSASALIALSQSLGGAVGLAISQNIFQSSLKSHLGRIRGIDQQGVVASGGVGLDGIVQAQYLDPVRDAFGAAIADAFLLAIAAAGLAFVVSMAIEWRRIGPVKEAGIRAAEVL